MSWSVWLVLWNRDTGIKSLAYRDEDSAYAAALDRVFGSMRGAGAPAEEIVRVLNASHTDPEEALTMFSDWAEDAGIDDWIEVRLTPVRTDVTSEVDGIVGRALRLLVAAVEGKPEAAAAETIRDAAIAIVRAGDSRLSERLEWFESQMRDRFEAAVAESPPAVEKPTKLN